MAAIGGVCTLTHAPCDREVQRVRRAHAQTARPWFLRQVAKRASVQIQVQMPGNVIDRAGTRGTTWTLPLGLWATEPQSVRRRGVMSLRESGGFCGTWKCPLCRRPKEMWQSVP
jgi:hypothetical protein